MIRIHRRKEFFFVLILILGENSKAFSESHESSSRNTAGNTSPSKNARLEDPFHFENILVENSCPDQDGLSQLARNTFSGGLSCVRKLGGEGVAIAKQAELLFQRTSPTFSIDCNFKSNLTRASSYSPKFREWPRISLNTDFYFRQLDQLESLPGDSPRKFSALKNFILSDFKTSIFHELIHVLSDEYSHQKDGPDRPYACSICCVRSSSWSPKVTAQACERCAAKKNEIPYDDWNFLNEISMSRPGFKLDLYQKMAPGKAPKQFEREAMLIWIESFKSATWQKVFLGH